MHNQSRSITQGLWWLNHHVWVSWPRTAWSRKMLDPMSQTHHLGSNITWRTDECAKASMCSLLRLLQLITLRKAPPMFSTWLGITYLGVVEVDIVVDSLMKVLLWNAACRIILLAFPWDGENLSSCHTWSLGKHHHEMHFKFLHG